MRKNNLFYIILSSLLLVFISIFSMIGFAAVEDFQYVSPGSYNVCACSDFAIPGILGNNGDVLSHYTITDLGTASSWTQVVPDYFSQNLGEVKNIATFVKVPCNANGQYTLYTKIDTALGLEKIHSMVLNVQKCKVLDVIPVDVKNQVCIGDVAVYDFQFVNKGIYDDIIVGSVDNLEKYSEFSLEEYTVKADSSLNGYLYIASYDKKGDYNINVTFTALKSGFQYTMPIEYEAIDCTVDVSKDKDNSNFVLLLWILFIILLLILFGILAYYLIAKKLNESKNKDSYKTIVDVPDEDTEDKPNKFKLWWINTCKEMKRRAQNNKSKFQKDLDDYEKQQEKERLAKEKEDAKRAKKSEGFFATLKKRMQKRREQLKKDKVKRDAKRAKEKLKKDAIKERQRIKDEKELAKRQEEKAAKQKAKDNARREKELAKKNKKKARMLLIANKQKAKEREQEKRQQEKARIEKSKLDAKDTADRNKKAAALAKTKSSKEKEDEKEKVRSARQQAKRDAKKDAKKTKSEKEVVLSKKKVKAFFWWLLIILLILLFIWFVWWLFSSGKVSDMVAYISNVTATSANDTLVNGTGVSNETLLPSNVSDTTNQSMNVTNNSSMNPSGIAFRNPFVELFSSYTKSCSFMITLFLVLFIASLFMLGIKIKRNWSKSKKFWTRFMIYAVPSVLFIALIFSFVFCVFNNVTDNTWPGTCKYIDITDAVNQTLIGNENISNSNVIVYSQTASECFCHTLFGNIPLWMCLLLIFLVVLIILIIIWISLSIDDWSNKYKKYSEKKSQEREARKKAKQKLNELRAKEKLKRDAEQQQLLVEQEKESKRLAEEQDKRNHEIKEQKIALATYKAELKAQSDKDKLDKKNALEKHREDVKLKKIQSKEDRYKENQRFKQQQRRRRKSNGILKDILLLLLLLLLILGIGSCFFDGNPLIGSNQNDSLFNDTNESIMNKTFVPEFNETEFIDHEITKNIICQATIKKSDVNLGREVVPLYSWYVLRLGHVEYELEYSNKESNLLDVENLEKDDLWICQVSLSDGSQILNTTPFKIVPDSKLSNELPEVLINDTKSNQSNESDLSYEEIDEVDILYNYVKENDLEDGFNYKFMCADSSEEIDLSEYFISSSNESLFFSVNDVTSEEITVNVWKGIATIDVAKGYRGITNVSFIAMDLNGNDANGVMTIIVRNTLWDRIVCFFDNNNTVIIIIIVIIIILLLLFIYAAIINHDNKPKKKVFFSRVKKQIVEVPKKTNSIKKTKSKKENELDYEINWGK